MKKNSGALVLPSQPSGSSSTNALDIRGIKPPVEIASPWLWIAIAAAVLALAIGLYLWWRWRKKQPSAKAVEVIPPHKKAKQRLAQALSIIHDPYAFCSEVSDALREYLEARFELHAPERTTEEFLIELPASSVLNETQQERLATFLTQCDLVKFARAEPTEAELRKLQSAALSLVEETEPHLVAPGAQQENTPEPQVQA